MTQTRYGWQLPHETLCVLTCTMRAVTGLIGRPSSFALAPCVTHGGPDDGTHSARVQRE